MIIPSETLAQAAYGAWMSDVVMPVGVPAPEIDPARVTPGLGGFVTFFALALAAWFLYRSFAVHMRRIDVRARLQAEEDARRAVEADGHVTHADPGEDPGVPGRSPGPADGPGVAPEGGSAVRS